MTMSLLKRFIILLSIIASFHANQIEGFGRPIRSSSINRCFSIITFSSKHQLDLPGPEIHVVTSTLKRSNNVQFSRNIDFRLLARSRKERGDEYDDEYEYEDDFEYEYSEYYDDEINDVDYNESLPGEDYLWFIKCIQAARNIG